MIRLRFLAPLALLLAPTLHAQNQVAITSNPQLKPISDNDVLATDRSSVRFGEVNLDWQAHSPQSRAHLIQVLSGRTHTKTVRAWDGQGDPSSAGAELSYVDGELVITDAASAYWPFEFRNELRNARRARWQLSRLPFVRSIDDWRSPSGMVANGEIMPVASRNNPSYFAIDLGAFLLGGERSPLANPSAVALTSMLHGSYPTGTLYLRAIGLGRNSSPIGLPSAGIRIDLAPLNTSTSAVDLTVLPTHVDVADYSALRPVAADLGCWIRPTRALELEPSRLLSESSVQPDGPIRQLAPIDLINLCDPAHGELLFAAVNAFGSTSALADDMQRWGAQRHEAAKELVRTEVQKRFGGTTAACSSQCRQALGLVLDQVMATIGGPPSTIAPDQALLNARGYLERMLIHAFRLHSGMGELFEGSATDIAAEFYSLTMRGTIAAAPPGFEPVDSKLYRPPMITLRVGTQDNPTEHGFIQLRELSRSTRLHPRLIPVPPLAAEQQIEIPVQLSSTQVPDVDDLMLPTQPELVAELKSGSALIERVSDHLAGMDKAIARAYRPAQRGSYKIELAWRDDKGGLAVIGVATCDADRDRCRFKARRKGSAQ